MSWTLKPVAEFSEHAEIWDGLNDAAMNTPLLSSSFVLPLLTEFADEADKLAIYRSEDGISAMAIITKSRTGAWRTFQPSQSPLGIWLQNEDFDLETAVTALFKALPSGTLQFSITQLDPALIGRPEKSSTVSTIDYIQTARVTLKGSFEDYWAARGKNLRQNLKRQRNRLQREETPVEFRIISATEDVSDAIAAYGKLESAGWKNSGGTAISADNAQGRFYTRLLENFCQDKEGIIFQYLYEGNLVASDLCLCSRDSFIILKTTYDEQISTTSPAMLMRQEEFEYVFDNNLAQKIEFYGKVMDWHTKWSGEVRTMYHVNVARNKLIGLLRNR